MMQSRRQVPSIAMMETSMPFSKTTLIPLATFGSGHHAVHSSYQSAPKACLSRPVAADTKSSSSTAPVPSLWNTRNQAQLLVDKTADDDSGMTLRIRALIFRLLRPLKRPGIA
jgi:hypothetical protein